MILNTCPVHSVFGQAFDHATEISKAKAQQKYFDASVVEVRKADLTKFLVSSLPSLPCCQSR